MHAAELVLAGRYIKCSVAARDLYPDVRWAEHLINVYHRKIRASADLSHAVKVKYPAPEPAAAPPTPAVVTPTPAMATPSPSAPSPMREGYRKCGGTFVEYQVRPHALPCPALAPRARASYRQCSSRAQVAVVDVATRYIAKDPSDYSTLTISELTGILLASGESTKGAKPDL